MNKKEIFRLFPIMLVKFIFVLVTIPFTVPLIWAQDNSINLPQLLALASSETEVKTADGYLDQFEDDTTDIEMLKKKALQQKQKGGKIESLINSLEKEKAKNATSKRGERGEEDKKTDNAISTNAKTKKLNSTSDNTPAGFMEQIKNTLRFGTYDEQNQLIKRLGGDCRRKVFIEKADLVDSKELQRVQEVVQFLEAEEYYKNAFKQDASLLLVNLELIQNCKLVEKLPFVERVLLEERRYMDYPEITRIAMKTKAWEIIADFINHLDEETSKNYAKLSEQYYRFERYHNNDTRIKRAALIAAGKLLPENLNQVLKQDYQEETNIDLKNTMLETIGFYKDKKDIDFYDKIIREPEGTQMHRWISVIAFTNYAPDLNALAKLKEYTEITETEIASRAYYVLGFYALPIDYYIEATKNNDQSIRLQAIEALAQFPLAEIEDVLNYKSTRDSSESVRKKAKNILEKKKATAP